MGQIQSSIFVRVITAAMIMSLSTNGIAQTPPPANPPDDTSIQVTAALDLAALSKGCDDYCERIETIAALNVVQAGGMKQTNDQEKSAAQGSLAASGEVVQQCKAYLARKKAEQEMTGLLVLDTAAAATCGIECGMNKKSDGAGKWTSKDATGDNLGLSAGSARACTVVAGGALAAEAISLLKIKELDIASPIGRQVTREYLFPSRRAPIEIAGWHPSLFERASSVVRYLVEMRSPFGGTRVAWGAAPFSPGCTGNIAQDRAAERTCPCQNSGGGCTTTADGYLDKVTTGGKERTSFEQRTKGSPDGAQKEKNIQEFCKSAGGDGTRVGNQCLDSKGNRLAGGKGTINDKKVADFATERDAASKSDPSILNSCNAAMFFGALAVYRGVNLTEIKKDAKKHCETIKQLQLVRGAMQGSVAAAPRTVPSSSAPPISNTAGAKPPGAGNPNPTSLNQGTGSSGSGAGSGAGSSQNNPVIIQGSGLGRVDPHYQTKCWIDSSTNKVRCIDCWITNDGRSHCRESRNANSAETAEVQQAATQMAATGGTAEAETYSGNPKLDSAVQTQASKLDISDMLDTLMSEAGGASQAVLSGMKQLGFSTKSPIAGPLMAFLDKAEATDWSGMPSTNGSSKASMYATNTSSRPSNSEVATSADSPVGSTAHIEGDGWTSGDEPTADTSQAAMMAARAALAPKPGEADVYHVQSSLNIFQIVSEKLTAVNDRIK